MSIKSSFKIFKQLLKFFNCENNNIMKLGLLNLRQFGMGAKVR